jgi:hypothetical protein
MGRRCHARAAHCVHVRSRRVVSSANDNADLTTTYVLVLYCTSSSTSKRSLQADAMLAGTSSSRCV